MDIYAFWVFVALVAAFALGTAFGICLMMIGIQRRPAVTVEVVSNGREMTRHVY
jgi:hypothetical protein